MLLGTYKISLKTFLIFILIILDPLYQIIFIHKVLDSQFKIEGHKFISYVNYSVPPSLNKVFIIIIIINSSEPIL